MIYGVTFFYILYVIQAIHSSFLDNIILTITKVMGNYGQIWLLVLIALFIPKILSFSFEFHLGAILPMVIVFLVSATETIGDISALTE